MKVVQLYFTLSYVDAKNEFHKRSYVSYIDMLDLVCTLKDAQLNYDAYITLYYENGESEVKPFNI